MTTKRLSLLAVVLFCLAAVLSGSTAFASHLRGTSINWAPTGATGTVQFTIQYSQRTSYGCPGTCVLGGTVGIPFDFGDGSAAVTVNATITSLNTAQDYLSAIATMTHTYSTAGPFIAFSENSARVQTIKSGENQILRMETTVNPFATVANPSPVAAMPAIVTVPLQNSTGFTVSASNPNGDKLAFRLSTASEMYDNPSFSCVAQQPPGLSINNSGVVTWDTTQITAAGCGFTQPASGDLWTVQFMVEDMDSNNNVVSKIPVDLIIEFIASTEALPTITFSNPGPITVNPGTPVTFGISAADASANSRVTFNVTGLPVGASATNINQSLTPPVGSTLTWTPTAAQVGSYVITYIATNDTFEQTLASVTVNVTSFSPPVTSCPVSLAATYNTPVSIPVQISDPQGDAVTVVWSTDGTVVHTDNVAASTGTTNLSLSQTFTGIGSHTVLINATNSNNLSSSCSTPITVSTANQVITFGALANLTYGAPDTLLGATSNSGLQVTYTITGSACSIVNGAVHTTGTGACSVTASQAGNSGYNPATPVTQTFQIAPRALTITAQNVTRQYGVSNPNFNGTVAGAVNNDDVNATYTSTATAASAVGTYPILATPSGTALANYTVTVLNGTLTVSKFSGALPPPTVSPMNAVFGTSVTITQSTTFAGPLATGETGTVTFYNGGTPIGTSPIGNGVATLTTSALPSGPDSITAQTSGDSNYNAATGAAVTDTVGAAPVVVTLTSSGTALTPTQPVTLTATLTSAGAAPSGTVQFYDGSTLLGTATVTGGVATLSTTLPAGSTNVITAQYPGSAVSAASQGNSNVTVLVAPLDFGYTLSSGAASTETVTAGAAAAYNLTVAPLYGGFPGVVNFTVTGLPTGATYTLSPATLPANSTGSAQVLTVQMPSATVAKAADGGFGSKLAPVLLGMLVLPLAGSRRMRKSGNRAARYGLLCLLLLLGAGAMSSLTGCGTGDGVYHQPGQSYTLTVTANSASISHSVTVTLNEQ